MRTCWLLLCCVAATARGQGPTIGSQMRLSLDSLCRSASETSGVASADGQEIVAGFVDFRLDGTIKNGFTVTSNGGATWTHLVVRPPAPLQDNLEADPMTAYDARTNTLFAGGISRAKCLYVARKVPGQNSFSPSVVARTSSWPDKGWMAAGPRYGLPNTTRLYLTYNEGILWSDDLGSSWTAPLSLGVGFGFLPRVGPNGELYLTYWDGYWGIKFSRSFDGGQTWTTPIEPATRLTSWGVENYGIPGKFRNFTNNTMAVNPTNGDIVILYVDQTNIVAGQKNLDLYLVRSEDRGDTWTSPVRLPFRPLSRVSDMIFPWVEFTKTGRLHLFAMDTSRNPGQIDGTDHGLWDQVYCYSDNSGVSWSPCTFLAQAPWDSLNDGTGGLNFLGDYQGMAHSDAAIWPLYPDTQTGRANVYANKISAPIHESVLPISYQVTSGEGFRGGLVDLYSSDDNRLSVFNDPSTLATEVVITGQASQSTGLELRLEVEANVERAGLAQQVHFYSWQAQQWVIQFGALASYFDQRVEIRTPLVNSFVASDGLVKAKLVWAPINDESPDRDGWLHNIDLVKWTLVRY